MLTVDFETLGLHAGDRLLDIGCGFGRHSFEGLRRGALVTASDFAMDELIEVNNIVGAMLEKQELPDDVCSTTCNGDVTSLPFPDAAFDHIIASEILEHIPDDRGAIKELFRILRPGGRIAATIPAAFPERVCWKLSDEYYAPKAVGGHVRIYAKDELANRLGAAGFDVTDSHRAHALHSPYWWLRCAVGVNRDIEDNKLTSLYHKLLTWDIVDRPALTTMAERVLSPVLGKSLVVYGTKPIPGSAQ